MRVNAACHSVSRERRNGQQRFPPKARISFSLFWPGFLFGFHYFHHRYITLRVYTYIHAPGYTRVICVRITGHVCATPSADGVLLRSHVVDARLFIIIALGHSGPFLFLLFFQRFYRYYYYRPSVAVHAIVWVSLGRVRLRVREKSLRVSRRCPLFPHRRRDWRWFTVAQSSRTYSVTGWNVPRRAWLWLTSTGNVWNKNCRQYNYPCNQCEWFS